MCWNHAGITVNDHDCLCLSQWLSKILEAYEGTEIQLACMICWEVWRNRNAIVWHQKGEEFDRVVASAKLTFSHWWNAQDRSYDQFMGFMTQYDGKEHWECPGEGKLKVNTDAAIFMDSNRYSFSMIVRDQKGELFEAKSSCRQGTIDPVLAEAMGIREALSWVKNKGCCDVTVETDCLAVIQAIRCPNVTLSYLGRVLDECKCVIDQLKERNIALIFVKRSANKVVHYLARHSSSKADRVWCRETIDPELHRVMSDDLKV